MRIRLGFDRLLEIVGPAAVSGATPAHIAGIAALNTAGPEDLSFLGNAKYRAEVATTRAGVILLPEDFEGEPAPGAAFVRVKNPSYSLALVCSEIERTLRPKPAAGVHPSAFVSPGATIGEGAHVGPLAVIEEGAMIGEGAVIEARAYVGRHARIGAESCLRIGAVVADFCEIGKRVIVQAGAIIGSDGFGYDTQNGEHRRIPQVGIVIVEDDVEIGANTTIDRARFSATRIGRGTKIDNLVQIAHNVVIGPHCMIVSQSGIAGSVTLGERVTLGGQVGLAGHIRVGDDARIGAQSGVLADVEPGAMLLDSPAMPFAAAKRLMVLRRRLPELFKKVDSLESRLAPPTN